MHVTQDAQKANLTTAVSHCAPQHAAKRSNPRRKGARTLTTVVISSPIAENSKVTRIVSTLTAHTQVSSAPVGRGVAGVDAMAQMGNMMVMMMMLMMMMSPHSGVAATAASATLHVAATRHECGNILGARYTCAIGTPFFGEECTASVLKNSSSVD